MPTALIITAAGINCDRELAHAFEEAGAEAELVHLNALVAEPALIEQYQLIGLPGGFSYGDAVAAGRIAEVIMRRHLYGSLVAAVERGVPIIAPCNGFQIAVQMGLLPGPGLDEPWPSSPPAPAVALAMNEGGRFVDRWVQVSIPAGTHCIWTEGLDPAPPTDMLPVAHAEGRFTPGGQAALDELDARGQIAVRYVDNPNGSAGDVAGICDASGLVLGLMPHPERYTRWTQHPWWTRLEPEERDGDPPGLAMFKNAVAHARKLPVAAGG
jgi:phosphoribosylformylglycinamidine synthase